MFTLRYASKLEKLIFFSHSGYQVNVTTFSKYVYTATRILMISVNFAFAFLHSAVTSGRRQTGMIVISPRGSFVIG